MASRLPLALSRHQVVRFHFLQWDNLNPKIPQYQRQQ
jgi:hypothetical protein